MDIVIRSDTPENVAKGQCESADRQHPEAMLRFHDSIVSPRHPDQKLVANRASNISAAEYISLISYSFMFLLPKEKANTGASIRKSHNQRGEIVRRGGEDHRLSAVEHNEPHLIASDAKPCICYNWYGQEY